MKYVSFVFLCAGLSGYSQSFDYLPSSTGNQILTYTQFTLSYNENHEQAEWVAYELTKEEAKLSRERCECFASDPNVDTGSARDRDYSSSGFDRGHLSPAADNNMSEQANKESFYFSNMSPQIPSFNRGIWEELENWVREKTEEYDRIYIVTGPIFINPLGAIGSNKVTIPDFFYKVILRFQANGSPKTIGFLLPHLGATGKLKEYVVPVNTIETLSGLDFFPELSNSIENRAESQFELNSWGFN